MASTIVTKNSSTASAVPVTGDLTQGELAVNVTDKKLYTKDSGGTVVKLVGGLGNQEANAVAITGGSINGTTVGATTASTGAFTTLSASSTVSGTGFSTYLASPPAIGGTAAAAGSFTTLSASSTTTLSGGTANGVAYLNGSKVVTTGSALVFDGTNLGIGTSSPGVKLDVAAATAIARLTSTTGTNVGYYQVSNTGGGLYIGRDSFAGGGFYSGSPAYGAIFLSTGAYPMTFAVDSVERMRLDSSGNLGLGVTPSAWASNRKVLQVGGLASAVLALNGTSAVSEMYFNSYLNTSAVNTYAANGYAGLFDFNGSTAGGYAWKLAASGTAGNSITFTQAMTLDASGNLGVGTTSPAGRLHIRQDTINAYFQCDNTGSITLNFGGTTTPNKGRILYSDNSDLFAFYTNSTERARIDSSGNFGLGVTSPAARLDVYSPSTTAATPIAYMGKALNDSTTSNVLVQFLINSGGTGSGQINANGASAAAFGTYSDERLKENIETLDSQLSNVCSLRPVEFDYKDGSGHQIGFIAQEMQNVYPDCIGEDSEGMLTITGWSKTEARLVKAIQEQQALITQLTERISALEAK